MIPKLRFALPFALLALALNSGCASKKADLPQNGVAAPGPAGTVRTIEVSGSARLDLHPDRAALSMTLSAEGHKLQGAHREVEAAREELLAQLEQEQGLRIEVAGLDYRPRYDMGALNGYEASQTIQVDIAREDFDRIPALLDLGGPQLHAANVRYYVDDMPAHKAKLRGQAIKAAGEKADALCLGFGARRGPPISIAEGALANTSSWGVDNFVSVQAAPQDEPGLSPPGTQPMRLRVDVVFELMTQDP